MGRVVMRMNNVRMILARSAPKINAFVIGLLKLPYACAVQNLLVVLVCPTQFRIESHDDIVQHQSGQLGTLCQDK
jgi:hypothetical protein